VRIAESSSSGTKEHELPPAIHKHGPQCPEIQVHQSSASVIISTEGIDPVLTALAIFKLKVRPDRWHSLNSKVRQEPDEGVESFNLLVGETLRVDVNRSCVQIAFIALVTISSSRLAVS
jgi:hypothetical protein